MPNTIGYQNKFYFVSILLQSHLTRAAFALKYKRWGVIIGVNYHVSNTITLRILTHASYRGYTYRTTGPNTSRSHTSRLHTYSKYYSIENHKIAKFLEFKSMMKFP